MSKAEYDNQGLSRAMQELHHDVIADEYWARHLRRVKSTLDAFDKGIAEELDLGSPTSGDVQSIVRYCIPLFEMHRAIDGVEPDHIWLTAMYLWQKAWRPLDNLLDNNGPFSANFREYNIAILRAWTFHSTLSPDSRHTTQFLTCLYDTLDAENNYEERVNPSLIFRRARLYEVVFDSLPGLSRETTDNFRAYINTVTIAHDFGDVVTDIKEGISTFATASLKRIDPHCRLTSKNYQELSETNEAAFQNQLLKLNANAIPSCWVTRRNINNFFMWAFRN